MLESSAPVVVDVYSKCWGPCEVRAARPSRQLAQSLLKTPRTVRPPVQMLEDKFTLLYFELAESSGLKFVRAEVAGAS